MILLHRGTPHVDDYLVACRINSPVTHCVLHQCTNDQCISTPTPACDGDIDTCEYYCSLRRKPHIETTYWWFHHDASCPLTKLTTLLKPMSPPRASFFSPSPPIPPREVTCGCVLNVHTTNTKWNKYHSPATDESSQSIRVNCWILVTWYLDCRVRYR